MRAAKKKNVLDNTLSVGVVLSRKRKRRMKREAPYEVEYRGVTIRCYTAEDAAKVAKEFAPKDVPYYAKWPPHEFLDFVHRVQVLQRRLLATLLKTKHGIATDDELRHALGVANNQALAGVLSGITKVAQLMDIDRSKIYSQRTEYKQGSPVRWYHLSEGFKSAAVDNDWPTEKDLEEEGDDDEDDERP